jgi:uncharacterized membrane protein
LGRRLFSLALLPMWWRPDRWRGLLISAVAVALLALSVGLPPGRAAPPVWSIVDLGTLPGGVESGALGLNDAGQVVGYSSADPYRVQSVGLWPNSIGTANGGTGPLTTGVLFSGGSVTAVAFGAAYGVNASGEVAGGNLQASGTGYAINDAGLVVGSTVAKGAPGEAFASSNGATTLLGTLPGDDQSAAYGVNASGEAVGYSGQSAAAGASAHHQAVLFSGGQVLPLGMLKGDTESWAFGVNDSGVAVGVSQGLGGSQAVLFKNGHVAALGVPAGDAHSQALGINADGVAVGTSDSDGFTFHAALFTGKDAIRLDTLLPSGSGWTLRRATAINDKGQIAGEGTHDGKPRAFMMTPPAQTQLSPTRGTAATSKASASTSSTAGPTVYVHYDYMAVPGPDGHTDAPDPGQIQAVIGAYAAHGITLVIDAHHSVIPESQALVFDEDTTTVLPPAVCIGPDWIDFSTLKAAYFQPTGNHPWHYAIFGRYGDVAETGNPNCAAYRGSGHALLPGYDFQITTGSVRNQFDASVGRGVTYEDGGTFMHELGHNLGLHHGGADDINFKPNYLSVMNYDFQLNGIPYGAAPGSTTPVGFRLDYSDVVLPTLDENHLNETLGLQDLAHPNDITINSGADCGGTRAPASGPVDWNCDGDATETDVAADVNGDSTLLPLTGFDDWTEIKQLLSSEAKHPVKAGPAVR